ncbi:hypothetical protein [Anaerobacillus arseniciselenatis]|nr:hypothetical protein [Anaerobacillus arseniciselenatis]
MIKRKSSFQKIVSSTYKILKEFYYKCMYNRIKLDEETNNNYKYLQERDV